MGFFDKITDVFDDVVSGVGDVFEDVGDFVSDNPASLILGPLGAQVALGAGGLFDKDGNPIDFDVPQQSPSAHRLVPDIDLSKLQPIDVPSLGDIEDAANRLPTVDLTPVPLHKTQVPLTPGLTESIGDVNRLFANDQSVLNDLLSGEPNFGELQRLQDIRRRDFVNFTQPGIDESFASGGSFDSGARVQAQTSAQIALADQSAQERFQAAELADQKALQALSLLPGLVGIQAIEQQNNISNIERGINTHFANEQQKLAEHQVLFNNYQFALQELGFISGVEQFNSQLEVSKANLQLGEGQLSLAAETLDREESFALANLEIQKQALNASRQSSGSGGLIGTVLGAGLGTLLPGVGNIAGAAIGAQLGGGIGNSIDSGSAIPLTSAVGSSINSVLLFDKLGLLTPAVPPPQIGTFSSAGLSPPITSSPISLGGGRPIGNPSNFGFNLQGIQ